MRFIAITAAMGLLLGGCVSEEPIRGDARFSAVRYGAPIWWNRALIGKDYYLTLPAVGGCQDGHHRFTIENAPGMTLWLEIVLIAPITLSQKVDGATDATELLRQAGTELHVRVMDERGGALFDHGGPLEATEPSLDHGWSSSTSAGERFYLWREAPSVSLCLGRRYTVELDVTTRRPTKGPVELVARFHRGHRFD